MTFLIAFAASFGFVFLRAFQQLNVVHSNYLWIVPTSLLMSACEVATISIIAISGWGWIVLFTGTGAGLGCVCAMLFHRYARRPA